MTDQEKPEDRVGTQVATQAGRPGAIQDTRQRDLGFSEELRDLISVERERIESQNKRTEVVKLAVEMNDAADKRQFDFQMAQLDAQKSGSTRKYVFASWVAGVCILIAATLLGLLFYMLFYGSPGQTETALAVMKTLGIGIGGYGLVGAMVRGVRMLINSMGKQGNS